MVVLLMPGLLLLEPLGLELGERPLAGTAGHAHVSGLAGVSEVVSAGKRLAARAVRRQLRDRRVEQLLLAGRRRGVTVGSLGGQLGERDVVGDRDGGHGLQLLGAGQVVGHQRVELGL